MGIAIFKNKIFGKIGIDFFFSLSLPMFFSAKSYKQKLKRDDFSFYDSCTPKFTGLFVFSLAYLPSSCSSSLSIPKNIFVSILPSPSFHSLFTPLPSLFPSLVTLLLSFKSLLANTPSSFSLHSLYFLPPSPPLSVFCLPPPPLLLPPDIKYESRRAGKEVQSSSGSERGKTSALSSGLQGLR